jgi:alkylhydroperoxidase/carboxymuconolactone decarboxylase family protein YurZ
MDPDYATLYARGKEIREQVLGADFVNNSTSDPNAFGASFQELTTAIAWGGVWKREGLALRDRSLITVVVLAALGRANELTMHLPGAIRNGVSQKELEEALIHLGLYAGFPATVSAIKTARTILEEK